MARKIKPNVFQRLIHRFAMLKPVTAFIANKTHPIDKFFLRFTKGKYTFTEFLGWNIVQLKTIGAKTKNEYIIYWWVC